MERLTIFISTDGACSGNPGPGGYAAVLRIGDYTKEVFGNEKTTSNNRMELQAVVAGLNAVKKPCNVIVRTDSTFVQNGLVNRKVLEKNGWKRKTGAKYYHEDLWKQVVALEEQKNLNIQCLLVKGHSGDPDNERANTLAQLAVQGVK